MYARAFVVTLAACFFSSWSFAQSSDAYQVPRTERFTRVSEDELFYQYTVDGPVYYAEPWRGEFSFTRDSANHIYEYSCHEGNYGMIGALRGERVVEVRAELESN